MKSTNKFTFRLVLFMLVTFLLN